MYRFFGSAADPCSLHSLSLLSILFRVNRIAVMKRPYGYVVGDQTLEETVYAYIYERQAKENGRGVGMTVDYLNKHIRHSSKPTGPNSEEELLALLRGMETLVECKKWKGKEVFQLQDSKIALARRYLAGVILNLRARLEVLTPKSDRVSIKKLEYKKLFDDVVNAKYSLDSLPDSSVSSRKY